MFGFFEIRKSVLDKLRKRDYRNAYVGAHVRRWIAYQIRALRDKKEWSQGKLAERLGKPQSVVSRLEDPFYGKMTVATLLEVAKAFDVALLIKFVDYRTFLRETSDLSNAVMQVESFDYSMLAASPEPNRRFSGWSNERAKKISVAAAGLYIEPAIDVAAAAFPCPPVVVASQNTVRSVGHYVQ